MTIGTIIIAEEKVARASLIQYKQTHVQIRVVAAKPGEWQQPQPEKDLFDAYVPAGSSIEAYLIVINSQEPMQPDDKSTWQELQGRIMEAIYSPSIPAFMSKHAATGHKMPEGGLVAIPASILEAAGMCRQEAFNVSPLSLEHSLSPTDLEYVRANCSR